MKRIVITLCLAVSAWGGAFAQDDQSGSQDISLSRQLSRTAVYVGDVFEYRVLVRYPKDFSFVTEELKDRLVLPPFEVLRLDLEEREWEDGFQLEVAFELVCWNFPGRLEIPSFDLFYYPRESLEAGSSVSGQDIPARALKVPAQPIHLQSTLLGESDTLRDSVTVLKFPRTDFILPGLAATLLLVFGGMGILLAVRSLMQRKQAEQKLDLQELQAATRQRLGALGQGGQSESDPALCLEVSKLLRQYLGSGYGLSLEALTPDEVSQELESEFPGSGFAKSAESLLERCDQAVFEGLETDLLDLCREAIDLVNSSPAEVSSIS